MNTYALFADELRRAQSGELSLLDEENGLIARWSDICEQSLQEMDESDDLNAWALERNTWQLVQRLYAERLAETRVPSSPHCQGSTSRNPYTPPLQIAQEFIEASNDLVELSTIRDWLHSIPTALNPAEIRRGYQPYTKNKLKQARRTGTKLPRGLVQELDPDSVLREASDAVGVARLESEDAAYERALIRSLFEYVRAGDLDLAIDMCRQSDQSWRAASLSGGKLWSDSILALSLDAFGDDMDVERLTRVTQGNVNRRLWKMMCRKLAAAPGADPYERALYGAISGDVASVIPLCSTWEDHIWTHVNALFEESVEAGLWISSKGRFWSRGSVQPIASTNGVNVEDALGTIAKTGNDHRRELELIFDKMLTMEKGHVGQSAKNPFHVSQTHLILGNIGELFTTFVDRLEAAAVDTEPETLSHLLRFFAHLVLIMRLFKQPVPDYAATRIIEAYVKVLEATNQDENLIAFYASNLDDDRAVESYAQFLITFGPESDRASRRIALLKTHDHGLDLSRIACRTVELILSHILIDAPDLASSSSLDVYGRVDPSQRELIRSLEWLTFDPVTYPDALTQANALVRYFLASAKPHAARELLLQLPPDLLPASAVDPDSTTALQIREYLDFTSFFECLEQHTRYSETWARKPRAGATKLDQTTFRDGVATLVDAFHSAAIDLLESDWLKLEINDSTLDARRRLSELARIRQMFIPELILRLHFTLLDTKDLIPFNLQRALDLANIVADERYQLYLEFISLGRNRVGEYLGHVRNAALASLGTESRDAFKSFN